MKQRKTIESPALFDEAAVADMHQRVVRAGLRAQRDALQAQLAATGLQLVREVRPFRKPIRKSLPIQPPAETPAP